MQQDLNPSPSSSLVIFWVCERQGCMFLAARLG